MKIIKSFILLAFIALCSSFHGCSIDPTLDARSGKVTAITVREASYVAAINWMRISLKDNETLQLTADVMPRMANNKNLTFSNKHPNLMTVDQNGLITGKAFGIDTLTISATDGSGISVSYQVMLVDHMVKATAINVTADGANMFVKLGNTFDLGSRVTLSPNDTWNKAITFTSNDESIVTISAAGIVTPVEEGTTTITIKTADGSNLSRDVNVTVQGIVQVWEDFNTANWATEVTTATGYTWAADVITGNAADGWNIGNGQIEKLFDGNINGTTAVEVGLNTYWMIAKPGKAYPYNRVDFPLADIPTQPLDFMPYFTIDMKQEMTLNYIIWGNRNFNNRGSWYGIRIYGSNDGTNFTQIRSEENEVADPIPGTPADIFWIPQLRGYNGDQGWGTLTPTDPLFYRLLFDESSYRYIKIELAVWSDVYGTGAGQFQHPNWIGPGSVSGLTINVGKFGLGYMYWD
jgi:uncharacterized protein YjdB